MSNASAKEVIVPIGTIASPKIGVWDNSENFGTIGPRFGSYQGGGGREAGPVLGSTLKCR